MTYTAASQSRPRARIHPVDYDGISHARLTRAMTQARLPSSAKVLMAEIFRAIPVGQWRHISQHTLHRRCGISEGTVSLMMRVLAGEHPDYGSAFISRRWVEDKGDGRGGYEICPLPPPELRRDLEANADGIGKPSTPSFLGSSPDLNEESPESLIQTPLAGIDLGSEDDPAIIYTQTCSSGSMRFTDENEHDQQAEQTSDLAQMAASPQRPASPTANMLPPRLPSTVATLGLLAHHWRALRNVAPPGYDMRACLRDLHKLATRRDVISPAAVLQRALERDEPIYSQAEIDVRIAEMLSQAAPPDAPPGAAGAAASAEKKPPRGKPRPEEAPMNPDAYRGRPGYAVGNDAPPPEREPEPDSIFAEVQRLAPDAHNLDKVFLGQQLLAGVPPDEALAAMQQRTEGLHGLTERQKQALARKGRPIR